jgi:3-deoxy-manno-octulosonate cytidylyltransferase (CMP-KDO synthetase)
MPKIACVIPARLQSSRFPRKILAKLGGRPLLQWAWEAALATNLFHDVAIAVDAVETADVVKGFGGKCFMTAIDCPSGTLRLAELLLRRKVLGDIFVCWQADEPFLHRDILKDLLQSTDDASDVWTLKKKLKNPNDVLSPHIPKVVTDIDGYALYFSRSPIPFHRDTEEVAYYKHIGIYAYTKATLLKLAKNPTCPLAEAEQLEQLNFLYRGLKVRVHETAFEGFGIDIPEHLEAAHHLIKK